MGFLQQTMMTLNLWTMSSKDSFYNGGWLRAFLDFISPRFCQVCGKRLARSEEDICVVCNLHLPRTYFSADAYENKMAKNFWGKIPVERCAALFFYQPNSESAKIVKALKYDGNAQIGFHMGKMMGKEFEKDNFFEGIDCIVPVPISRKRRRHRGYNQSCILAFGIAETTALPVVENAVKRKVFVGSQTNKSRMERNENVEDVYKLLKPELLTGKHILLVDDVVTTGATICSCAKEICKAGNVKISVVSLGYTK